MVGFFAFFMKTISTSCFIAMYVHTYVRSYFANVSTIAHVSVTYFVRKPYCSCT